MWFYWQRDYCNSKRCVLAIQVSTWCVASLEGLLNNFSGLIKETTQMSILIDLGLRFEAYPQLEAEVLKITLDI
jgi:hypothetical protein